MKDGEFKIDKGVPIPARKNFGMSGALRSLKVGESVLLPTAYPPTNLIRQIGGLKATMRRVEGGYRVWRIK